MAAVLELAALKVIPETNTQPGFSHRFTTKLAQAQGHGDLFRARFSIPILTFSFTFTLKRRALVTLPGLGLTRGCSFFLLPFFFFLLPFFFLSLRGLRVETANLAAAACTQRGWHAPSYETSWKVPRSKTAARRKFSGRRRPGHDASPARLNYFISSLTGSKLYTIAQCTII